MSDITDELRSMAVSAGLAVPQRSKEMGVIRHRLTRIHLWIGEALGLTHYRSCWGCGHCREYGGDERDAIWCDVDYDEDGVLAITNPSEAVWCRAYEEGEWKRLPNASEFERMEEVDV